MTALTNFDFDGAALRVVMHDDEPWFVAKDVAEVLGYSDAFEMTKRLDSDEKQNRQIAGFGPRGVSLISESGLFSAILGSQKAEAKRFKRWVTHEVLPQIRKTGGYSMKGASAAGIEAVQMAEAISDALRLEGSARLGVVQKAIQLNAPQHLLLLPSYAVDAPMGATAGSSEVTASLSELLKEHGVRLSAAKANQMLADAGLIERLSRPSTKGAGDKHFWSVTRKGAAFAKNLSSPSNPRETQPHWFVSKFDEVLGFLDGESVAA